MGYAKEQKQKQNVATCGACNVGGVTITWRWRKVLCTHEWERKRTNSAGEDLKKKYAEGRDRAARMDECWRGDIQWSMGNEIRMYTQVLSVQLNVAIEKIQCGCLLPAMMMSAK